MMTASRAQILIDDFETNTWLIHRHVDGVSDEDSLLQLPFQANCLNWILGHIIWRRNSVLSALGLAPLWNESTALKYKTDSKAIKSQADAVPFTDLLADLDQTNQAIIAALKEVTDSSLDEVVKNDRGEKRVIEHLQGFHWHETYHIGQLDILRAFINSKKE
jgi:hypothetical protein